MVLSGPGYLDAVVVEHVGDGSPQRLLELPGDSDSIAVEALPGGALVAAIAVAYRAYKTGTFRDQEKLRRHPLGIGKIPPEGSTACIGWRPVPLGCDW